MSCTMKAIYPLVVLSCAFMIFRVGWATYMMITHSSAMSKNCQCVCNDTNSFSSDLKSSVYYTGARIAANSCSCDDFFLPKIKGYFEPVDVRFLCSICKCDVEKDHASEFRMTFEDMFDFTMVTVFVVTLLLLFYRWLELLNYEVIRERVQNKLAYNSVKDMHEKVTQAATKVKEMFTNSGSFKVAVTDHSDRPPSYQTFNAV